MSFQRVFVSSRCVPSMVEYVRDHSCNNQYYSLATDKDRLTAETTAQLDESLSMAQRFGIQGSQQARKGAVTRICQQLFDDQPFEIGIYQPQERWTYKYLESAAVIVLDTFTLAQLAKEGKLQATDLVILSLSDCMRSPYMPYDHPWSADKQQTQHLADAFVSAPCSLIWLQGMFLPEGLKEQFATECIVKVQTNAAVAKAKAEAEQREEQKLNRQAAAQLQQNYKALEKAHNPNTFILTRQLIDRAAEIFNEVLAIQNKHGWYGMEKWGESYVKIPRPVIEALNAKVELLNTDLQAHLQADQEIRQTFKALYEQLHGTYSLLWSVGVLLTAVCS